MLNAIQTGIFTPSTKQRLIDSFVNAVYLYEDKIILTFNYKDGSKTITLAEIEGSDLSVLGAGLKTTVKNELDSGYGGVCFIPSLSLYQTRGYTYRNYDCSGDPVHFLKLHQTAENVQSRARAENGSDRILPDL